MKKKLQSNADRWSRNFSIIVLVLLVAMAIFAPIIAPYSPIQQNLAHKLLPPLSEGHILGTDNLGIDILSRLIYGSRVSLFVGLTGTFFGMVVGLVLGLISGYYGGWLDTVIMRLGDVQLAFPFVLLALAIMGVLGPGINNIIICAIITGWIKYVRVIRSDVLKAKDSEYIMAAKALGLSDIRILKQIFVNCFSSALVVATLETGRIILMESSLTFLGLGVPTETPTWGSMLADGRTYMRSSPWLAMVPGLAITLT
ncbi:MAG TPA: peptide ABC transporter permease, partial [Clostridiales bacterium]|nr:peptide ABC transporter permease [Clostridiales bacterium]